MARYRRKRQVVRLGDTLAGTSSAPAPGARSQRAWHVVVLTDAGRRRLYTVMTQDVGLAVMRARDRHAGGYAYEHGLGRLVLAEGFGCRHTAYARMMRIRGWPVATRRALIAEANPDWRDLASEWGVEDEALERGQPTGREAASAA